jgi:hypothetical protein
MHSFSARCGTEESCRTSFEIFFCMKRCFTDQQLIPCVDTIVCFWESSLISSSWDVSGVGHGNVVFLVPSRRCFFHGYHLVFLFVIRSSKVELHCALRRSINRLYFVWSGIGLISSSYGSENFLVTRTKTLSDTEASYFK